MCLELGTESTLYLVYKGPTGSEYSGATIVYERTSFFPSMPIRGMRDLFTPLLEDWNEPIYKAS